MRGRVRNVSKDLLQHVLFRDGFLWRVPGARDIALTFDDGPDPDFTPAVLDLLKELDVRATFFLVGNKVDAHPELAARLVAEGHAVGGHGYDHQVITSMSRDGLGEDLRRCAAAIGRATGLETRLFRPPKGEVDLGSIYCSVRTHGYRLAHWSLTYSDYRRDGLQPLLDRMRHRPPRAGDVILLHDNNPYTVDALAKVLPDWRRGVSGFVAL